MSLEIGQSLGQYRLVSKLGEGGMGVVWRATDTVLGRDVALKALPDFFASDPERLARFEREAKLLASVNHPNIAAIYGFHAADQVRFLAMELVEGEDLSRLLARGPLDVQDVLSFGRQIAEALETAHERGIVHRDLKPANIKIGLEGRVKVLDFGLAKAMEDESSSAQSPQLSQSPTITGRLTSPHVLLGTAAYMSPEQTRGQAADKRADIWAFGVILFEMLAGKQLFEGETVSDTLASVLKTELNWDRLPAQTPLRLEALVRRCLVRDPRRRLRDIGEARIALEEIAEGKGESVQGTPAIAPPVSPSRRGAVIGGAVLLGLLLGTVVGALLLPKPAAKLPMRQFILAAADTAGNPPLVPAVSPDGKHVAFMRGGKLWIQELAGLDAHPVDIEVSNTPLTAGYPFWSPDSREVGYLSGTRIIKVSVASRQSTIVTDVSRAFTNGRGAAWCEDGTILTTRAEEDGLLSVPALGGDAHAVLLPDSTQESDFHEPSPLPGGGAIFAVHRRQGLDTIALIVHGKRKNVLTMEGQRLGYPVYSPSGHIVFQRQPTNGGIWAAPFSLAKQEVTGEPFLIVSGGGRPTLADDGTLVYLRGSQSTNAQPIWTDGTGRELGVLGGAESGYQATARVSPDGQRVLISQAEDLEANLFVIDPARGTKTRLTFEKGFTGAPAWSPDGRRVVYQWSTGSVPTVNGFLLFSRAVDGTDSPDTLLRGGVLPSISPDGHYLLYSADPSQKWEFDLMARPLEGGQPFAIARGTGDQFCGVVSPHGDLVAYASDESGTFQIYLKRFPSGDGRWQVSTVYGTWPRWNAKGDRLYYLERNDLMEVEVGAGSSPVLGAPKRLFTRPSVGGGFRNLGPAFDLAPNGRFLFLKPFGQSAGTMSVAAIQNWYAGFRDKKS